MNHTVTRTINASPETLWNLLVDAPNYAAWDNGVVRIEGTIAEGNAIKVFSEISPDRAFPTKVAMLDAPKKMVWTGGMPLGLFKGVRTFTLMPDGDTTQFTMTEVFSGPLLGMISKRMPDLQPTFEHFADGLRAAAES